MALHVMDEANQCLGCKKPRCQQGCPIQTNIPEVIRLLKANKLDEAGRKAGIVRCCLRMKAQHAARFGIYLSGWSCWRWALTGWGHRPLYRYHAPSARGPDGILPT